MKIGVYYFLLIIKINKLVNLLLLFYYYYSYKNINIFITLF